MKHFFFPAALVLSALTAHAQKGSIYLGGQAGFNSTSTKLDNGTTTTTTSKASNWSFSPEIGTFLTNQVQLGVGFTFSGSRLETPAFNNNITAITKRYGGTVYGRYFFGEGNFRPFLGLNVSLLPGNSRTERSAFSTTTSRSTTFDVGANLNAGFAYGLNKRLTVLGSFGTFGFQNSVAKEDGTNNKTTTTDFGLNVNTLGNLFTIGVYYTLTKPSE